MNGSITVIFQVSVIFTCFYSSFHFMALSLEMYSRIPEILGSYTLAEPKSGLSVLSYNVLLPNSKDGWWTYKNYSPRHHINLSETMWKKRKYLLCNQIANADSDIVCLQEVCADSFDEDFKFMIELGYDQNVLFKRGRFRPATFWRSNRVSLYDHALHKDRCLITAFRPIPGNIIHSHSSKGTVHLSTTDSDFKNPECGAHISVDNTVADAIHAIPYAASTGTSTDNNEITTSNRQKEITTDVTQVIWVANCHLAAGHSPGASMRRIRQMHDCLDSIKKEQTKALSGILKAVVSSLKTNSARRRGESRKERRLEATTEVRDADAVNRQTQLTARTPPITAISSSSSSSSSSPSVPASSSSLSTPSAAVEPSIAPIVEYSEGYKLPTPTISFGVVIAGDMNVDGRIERCGVGLGSSGLDELLTKGSVGPDFLEDGWPVCNKVRVNKLGVLVDAYEQSYSTRVGKTPPPTMIGEELYGVITHVKDVTSTTAMTNLDNSNAVTDQGKEVLTQVQSQAIELNITTSSTTDADVAGIKASMSGNDEGDGKGEGDGDGDNVEVAELSSYARDLFSKIFDQFASSYRGPPIEDKVMTAEDVKRWLLKINLEVGRGSEFRAAVTSMNATVTPASYTNVAVSDEHIFTSTLEVPITQERCAGPSLEEFKSLPVDAPLSPVRQVEEGDVEDSSITSCAGTDLDTDTSAVQRCLEQDTEIKVKGNDGDGEETSPSKRYIIPKSGYLTREAFLSIYDAEIALGKVWSVAYDLAACGIPLPEHLTGLFKARFDRIYVSGTAYHLDAKLLTDKSKESDVKGTVREVLLAVRDTGGHELKMPIPSEVQPSDHLPVMVVVAW